MNTKITQALVAGIAATVVMTIVMMIAPMMGMPKMNPPAMLAGMMGMPLAVGWIMHFMVGIIFAGAYVYFFQPKVKISNKFVKGILYGVVIFIFAQIAMTVMGAMIGGIPEPEGSMLPIIIGGVMGHVIFGIVVALMAKEPKSA